MQRIFFFIGPKGGGKTYVGELLEQELDILFLQVEPFFITAKKDRDDLDEVYFEEAWTEIRSTVDELLKENNMLSLESVGTFTPFKRFLKELQFDYDVTLVKIKAPLELCKERIKERDADIHVAMPEAAIDHFNKLSLEEKYNYDVEIDNENSTDEEIVKMFKTLL